MASNPAASGRLLRRLVRDPVWAVRAAMAGRDDLSARDITALMGDVPAVLLVLAANEAVPSGSAYSLAIHRDEVIRGVALGNGALAASDLAWLMRDLDRPAWMLRSLASNPRLPSDEQDRLLTWLALGGATGDPTFDPRSCTGRPPGTEHGLVSWSEYYRIEASGPRGGRDGSLWRARRESVRMGPGLNHADLFLCDAHVDVRAAAADRVQLGRWRQLLWDENDELRARAMHALGYGARPRERDPIAWMLRLWHRSRVAIGPLLAIPLLVAVALVARHTLIEALLVVLLVGLVLVGSARHRRRTGLGR